MWNLDNFRNLWEYFVWKTKKRLKSDLQTWEKASRMKFAEFCGASQSNLWSLLSNHLWNFPRATGGNFQANFLANTSLGRCSISLTNRLTVLKSYRSAWLGSARDKSLKRTNERRRNNDLIIAARVVNYYNCFKTTVNFRLRTRQANK